MTLVGFFVPVDPPVRKTAVSQELRNMKTKAPSRRLRRDQETDPEEEDPRIPDPVREDAEDWTLHGIRPKKGSPMRSEAEILTAMASGSLQDQRALLIELEALRRARTASLHADREIDLGGAVMADHLTPVLTHEHHTAATDWVLEDDLFAADVPEGDPAQLATVEASMWFGRVSPEVKADRSEFAEQAMGMARVVAGRFGERAGLAERAFLDHVGHLHGKTANEIDGEEEAEDTWPLDPGGPMKPSIETGEIDNPAIKTSAGEGWPVDPNVMEKPDVLPWDSPPETTGDTREARRTTAFDVSSPRFDAVGHNSPDTPEGMRNHLTNGGHNRPHMGDVSMADMTNLHSFEHRMNQGGHSHPDLGRRKPNPITNRGRRTAAGDSPGQVNEDQSGNAESTITTYDTDADQEPWLADDWPEGDETGPVAVHPPMPGAGEATARRVRAADEEEQSGEGQSSFPEVGVTDPQAQVPDWPWEMGEPNDQMVGPSGEEGTGAADVADVPTPGGEAGYPQPKESAKIKAFRDRVQSNLEQTRRTR